MKEIKEVNKVVFPNREWRCDYEIVGGKIEPNKDNYFFIDSFAHNWWNVDRLMRLRSWLESKAKKFSKSSSCIIKVLIPYTPYLRQDKNSDFNFTYSVVSSIFGQKFFTNDAKGLVTVCFNTIMPHNLTFNSQWISYSRLEYDYFKKIKPEVIVYPDRSSGKRYKGFFDSFKDYVTFTKRRSYITGMLEFEPLEKKDKEKVKNKVCVIVDDILSRGGTFRHCVEVLRKAGAKKVYLFITHNEKVANKDFYDLFDGIKWVDYNFIKYEREDLA